MRRKKRDVEIMIKQEEARVEYKGKERKGLEISGFDLVWIIVNFSISTSIMYSV